ncbi:hypothetical protein DsansV1_C29g0209281 [Dioscorea sansibarensis]
MMEVPEDHVDLVDLVFSWSLEDILNHDLFRNKIMNDYHSFAGCFLEMFIMEI